MVYLLIMTNILSSMIWNSKFQFRILHLLDILSWNMVMWREPALSPRPVHLLFVPVPQSRSVSSLLHLCLNVPAYPHCLCTLSLFINSHLSSWGWIHWFTFVGWTRDVQSGLKIPEFWILKVDLRSEGYTLACFWAWGLCILWRGARYEGGWSRLREGVSSNSGLRMVLLMVKKCTAKLMFHRSQVKDKPMLPELQVQRSP